MKTLETIRRFDYALGRERTIFGYYKKGVIVQGYNSFGPVAVYCRNMKEAQELIKEEEYEDAYARLIAKPGRMFVELNIDIIYKKMVLRREQKTLKPEPECKGIFYSWDGTPLHYFTGSYADFCDFEKNHKMGPGDRFVYWYLGDKYVTTCDYQGYKTHYTSTLMGLEELPF